MLAENNSDFSAFTLPVFLSYHPSDSKLMRKSSQHLTPLSATEQQYYQRHLALPHFGAAGQLRLKNSRILMVGCGGLGCPALTYLAAAGVGTIGLIDGDCVDYTNLHRQTLYIPSDVGRLKTEAAAERLQHHNPHINVQVHSDKLSIDNVQLLLQEFDYDLVLDGVDNFSTKYLLNDACVKFGKPLVLATVHQFEGQLTLVNVPGQDGKRSPNWRDLFPEMPAESSMPNCAEAGVLGVLPGVMGTLMAVEAIKYLTGIGELLTGRLLVFNALSMRWSEFAYSADSQNPLHGLSADEIELAHLQSLCATSNDDQQAVDTLLNASTLTPAVLWEWIISQKPFTLIDVREAAELALDRLENSQLVPFTTLQSDQFWIDFSTLGLSSILGERIGLYPIVLYCQSGKRSSQALTELMKRYPDLHWHHLQGGLSAYRAFEVSDFFVQSRI
jgi:sulfur-carrier protein adenylyltransferase/sulfurtransferase